MKKIIKNISVILLVSVALIIFMAPLKGTRAEGTDSSGQVNSDYEVITNGSIKVYCNVGTSKDGYYIENSIRRYENYFNRPPHARGCRKRIDFDTKKMEVAIPLQGEIKLTSGGSLNEWLVFGPDDGEYAGFMVDNQSFVPKETTGTDFDSQNCAITVKHPYTVIQNITISGNKGNWGETKINGLCINAEHVVIKNVKVDNMSGSGILLGPAASAITFEGQEGAVTSNEYGINIVSNDGTWDLSRSIQIPQVTVGVPQTDSVDYSQYTTEEDCQGAGGQWNTRDEVCESATASEEVSSTFNFYSNTKRNIKSPVKAYITASQLKITAMGSSGAKFNVQGQLVTCDFLEDSSCMCGENYAVSGGKLLLYSVPQGAAIGQRSFIGECPFLAGEKNKGKFRCTIKMEDLPKDNQGNPNRKMFMVPMTKAGDIGSSTEIFTLGDQPGQESCAGDGGPPEDENYLASMLVYQDETQCDQAIGLWDWTSDYDRDSDGDGLKDIVEMMLRLKDGKVYISERPVCGTSSAITKWTNTDSDGDGIEDGIELRCKSGIPGNPGGAVKDAQDQIVSYMLCGIASKAEVMMGDIVWHEIGEVKDVLMDADQDNTPDALEEDSDNDGKYDWVENRAKMFRGGHRRKAYLYSVGKSVNDARFMPFGERIACYIPPTAQQTDPDVPSPATIADIYKFNPEKGFSYGIYIIDYSASQVKPFSIGVINELKAAEKVPGTDYDVKALKCLSSSLEDESSFNERFDGADCSNYLDKDSKDCRTTCDQGEVIRIIEDTNGIYINEDNNTLIPSQEDDNIPQLFYDVMYSGKLTAEDLEVKCGDFDEDGIPNCVEAAVANNSWFNIGQCGPYSPTPADYESLNVGDEFSLSPYLADSDGDGKGDGYGSTNPDICPMEYDSATGSPSCDPYDIYISFPILAFYLDRDGDGLRDIDEYRTLNDSDDPVEELLAYNGIPQTTKGHSDPISEDSDGDKLNDRLEREFGTNPSAMDSDDDGLDDYTEVNFDGNPSSSVPTTGKSYLCGQNTKDTDPMEPDTDKDGLEDGIEVNITGTSPNDPDSDNDQLCDGDRIVDGSGCIGFELIYMPSPDQLDWQYAQYESNPCDADTDNDNWPDGQEEFGCRGNPDDTCVGIDDPAAVFGTGKGKLDSDQDGLPDAFEALIGTNPNKQDTDGDGLFDGCRDGKGELCMASRDDWVGLTAISGEGANVTGGSVYFKRCTPPDFHNCDTNPLSIDSDGDGLTDDLEYYYPSNPWEADSDHDCIPDGIEDANKNGQFDSGETKVASAETTVDGRTDQFEAIDTDADGLPDGKHPVYKGWEDGNCDGVVDVNETNPRNWDTDFDGISDYDERTAIDGYFNPDRQEAVTPRGRGCSLVAGSTIDPGMMAIFLGLVMSLAGVRRKFKKRG